MNGWLVVICRYVADLRAEVEGLGNLFVLIWPYVLCCYCTRKATRLTIVPFRPLLFCPFLLSYFPSTVHDRAEHKCRKWDCSVCTGELRTYRKIWFKNMHLQHSMRREDVPNVLTFLVDKWKQGTSLGYL